MDMLLFLLIFVVAALLAAVAILALTASLSGDGLRPTLRALWQTYFGGEAPAAPPRADLPPTIDPHDQP